MNAYENAVKWLAIAYERVSPPVYAQIFEYYVCKLEIKSVTQFARDIMRARMAGAAAVRTVNMNPTVRDSDLHFFTRYAKRELEHDRAEAMCRADGTLDTLMTAPVKRLRHENLRDLIRETSR